MLMCTGGAPFGGQNQGWAGKQIMSSRLTTQYGFTLGELMITVAVVAIIVAIAVPSFDQFFSNNRRANAINQLVSTMHVARSEAVTRNVQITICPSSNGQSCDDADWHDGWIYFTDANRNRQRDAGETILGALPGMRNLEITSMEFGDFIVYRPNGRAMGATVTQNTGQFTFCDHRGAAASRALMITPSGQPLLAEDQPDCS